jgi:hypothetical protein
MTIHNGGSSVNPHPSPAAKSVVSGSEKVLTVDVYRAGEVNVALDMPEYPVAITETGQYVMGGGHRCGAFTVEDAIAFRDALTEAIEFSQLSLLASDE